MQVNKFFLIDDDTMSNYIDTKLIQNAMFAQEVKVFNYANIALNELKRLLSIEPIEFPDIILLDIHMPYMNGWQFLEEYQMLPKSVLKKCKLFMFSSSVNPNDIEKSKTYKLVKGFISKPLTSDKLFSIQHK